MKPMVRFSLVMVGIGLIFAQRASRDAAHTYSELNGRGLAQMTADARLAYLEGVKDGISTLYGRSLHTPCAQQLANLRTDYQMPFASAEYLPLIEDFYAHPENLGIAVPDAVEVIVAKLRNVPAAAIEQRIREHRQVAATAPELRP